MLLRLLAAALLALGFSSAAQAQVPQVVPTCGVASGLSLPQGPGGRLTVSPDGTLCTTAGVGGGSGGQTGSVTSAGTNGTQAQAVQGINGGVNVGVSATSWPLPTGAATAAKQPAFGTAGAPSADVLSIQGVAGGTPQNVTATSSVQDGATTTYAITGTGPQVGVPLKDYASLLAHLLTGSYTATVEYSINSTNGTDGDWDAIIFGYAPEAPGSQLGTTMTASTRRRVYNTNSGAWARINVTAFTSAGSIALIRRTEPYAERSVFVAGGTTGLAAGTNVVGSTTLRSAGTNRSATVGTTAVALWPSDTARQGGWVKNDTATALWCNFDGTATAVAGGGNFQIAANGGAYTTEPGFVSTNALSCISTASIAITSRTH